MIQNVNAAAVGASAASEASLGAEVGAATGAASVALTGVMPMGADLDSVQFAAAMNAAGVAYIASAAEHVGAREAFSAAQCLASGTYVTADAACNAALSV
jgi:hypothetical protein